MSNNKKSYTILYLDLMLEFRISLHQLCLLSILSGLYQSGNPFIVKKNYLASKLQLSTRTIINLINDLRSKGLLITDSKGNNYPSTHWLLSYRKHQFFFNHQKKNFPKNEKDFLNNEKNFPVNREKNSPYININTKIDKKTLYTQFEILSEKKAYSKEKLDQLIDDFGSNHIINSLKKIRSLYTEKLPPEKIFQKIRNICDDD